MIYFYLSMIFLIMIFLYFFLNKKATVKPLENFSSAQDAHLLRQEMKGFGTDEQAIVDILTARSNSQRVAIVKFFHSEMDRDLVEDLTCELGSNYEDLTAALLFAPVEYAIRQINQILDGFDEIDDLDLVEIICTRPADQIRTIAKRYRCRKFRLLLDFFLIICLSYLFFILRNFEIILSEISLFCYCCCYCCDLITVLCSELMHTRMCGVFTFWLLLNANSLHFLFAFLSSFFFIGLTKNRFHIFISICACNIWHTECDCVCVCV